MNTDNPYTFVMPARNVKLVAVFEPKEVEPTPELFTLTVEGGTGSGQFEQGTTVEISADIPEGMRFVQWSDGDANNPRQFTMPAHDVTLTVITEQIPESQNTLYLRNGVFHTTPPATQSAEYATVFDNRYVSGNIVGDTFQIREWLSALSTRAEAQRTPHLQSVVRNQGGALMLWPVPSEPDLTHRSATIDRDNGVILFTECQRGFVRAGTIADSLNNLQTLNIQSMTMQNETFDIIDAWSGNRLISVGAQNNQLNRARVNLSSLVAPIEEDWMLIMARHSSLGIVEFGRLSQNLIDAVNGGAELHLCVHRTSTTMVRVWLEAE